MKRTTTVLVVLVSTLVLGLGACSSSDTPTDTSTGSTPAGNGSSGSAAPTVGPVTIDHRYGSTTLEGRPQKIVSLDNQWTDVLVALGAPLVGAALDPMIDGGRYPWQDVIPPSVVGIPISGSIPFEAVADLDPDLIVVSWGAQNQGDYDLLSQLAPTIPLLGDEEVDAWQDMAAVAGQFLGEPDAAQALVDDTDQLVTDLAAELPGLEGKTYALANYVPGDGIYVVADPDDGAAQFFAQLGMSIDPDLVAMADGASGRAKLSLERIDELDADLLILLTNGADTDTITGYANLPAVGTGAVALLDLAPITGLNTPTPLSIPYSIDAVRPALEAAAAA